MYARHATGLGCGVDATPNTHGHERLDRSTSPPDRVKAYCSRSLGAPPIEAKAVPRSCVAIAPTGAVSLSPQAQHTAVLGSWGGWPRLYFTLFALLVRAKVRCARSEHSPGTLMCVPWNLDILGGVTVRNWLAGAAVSYHGSPQLHIPHILETKLLT